ATTFTIRLRPDAAARARPTAGRARSLGLASLDREAAALGGAWFEPEFLGERAPIAGSDEIDWTSFYRVHLPPGAGMASSLARFRALPEVLEANPIPLAPVAAIPNDSLFTSAYYFDQPSRRDLHAPEAWDLTTGDTSIVVAIVDTGLL